MTSLYRSMLSFGVLLTIGCATLSDEELDLSCDGPIAESTTRSELVDRFGPANVTDEEIGVGEGETVDGTAIFPEDASRRIEIVWHDPDRKNRIASIRVQEPSVWRLGGLTTGLDLETTEQLNGRSFSLYGFEWDYAGTISSWNGGAFDAPGECRILA
ncbi:MAG: hypothetical protein R3338_14625, partial [Thermoanaerobaculia bacterium]|nr:hypothetical protein [Thermoanaerobaculia bacterium]